MKKSEEAELGSKALATRRPYRQINKNLEVMPWGILHYLGIWHHICRLRAHMIFWLAG